MGSSVMDIDNAPERGRADDDLVPGPADEADPWQKIDSPSNHPNLEDSCVKF